MTAEQARQILGLPLAYSEADLRTAYYRKAKETHPDIVLEEVMAHFCMIEVSQAHHLLRDRITNPVPTPKNVSPVKGDYDLYKRGVSIFEKIHPSEWIKVTTAGLFDPSALEPKEKRSVAFEAALRRIGEAYRVFSDLINDFPDSVWAGDSREKLKTLDKMVVRYKKMARNGT